MPESPDVALDVVLRTRYIDETELTHLDNKEGSHMVILRLAPTRWVGGMTDLNFDADGNRRAAFLRSCSPLYDQPYLVVDYLSIPEMRTKLTEEWGGYTVESDGCDIFSPAWEGSSYVIPETCDTCDGSGFLVGQTYGHTSPVGGAVIVQACDACAKYPGDIEAAGSYAGTGGRVHAIGDGENLAPQSDVWIIPGEEPGLAVWHPTDLAVKAGWYHHPDIEEN